MAWSVSGVLEVGMMIRRMTLALRSLKLLTPYLSAQEFPGVR